MSLEKIYLWLWLVIVALLGAIVGLSTKANFNGLDKKTKSKKIAAGTLASVFVAYITFEMTYYFFSTERFSIACAGIASYLGTDALVVLGNIFISLMTKGKTK
ncbi:MAG: phage holin family protein [Campylobacteraceae bacterium]|jgi:hypothetical protein|nr:phage holin family protein [Campylobacteraceae bacterium]